MYIKKIKFEDFDGNMLEEDFLFHLSKAELTELHLSHKGGIDKYIERISKERDGKKIIELFKEIICMSYGVKSDDGRKFIKNEQVLEDFVQTNAYSELFMELATNADSAATFMNNIIPKDLAEQVKKEALKNGSNLHVQDTE